MYLSTFVDYWLFFTLTIRALELWGSQEALTRERSLRKEEDNEYQESRLLFSAGWLLNRIECAIILNILSRSKSSTLCEIRLFTFCHHLIRRSIPLSYYISAGLLNLVISLETTSLSSAPKSFKKSNHFLEPFDGLFLSSCYVNGSVKSQLVAKE